ncbi:MAG: response regulator [Tepidisphaerales bacterium]
MTEPDINAIVEVLLVEDNPADAELALHALRRQHVANHIQWVQDGAAALDFLFCTGTYAERDSRNKPRMVLLDLKLPKIDGLEVLKRIKAHPETRTIPVVVMTSSNEERDLVESYRFGVNSYVVKPVDFARFSEAVRQLGMYWLLLNKTPES